MTLESGEQIIAIAIRAVGQPYELVKLTTQLAGDKAALGIAQSAIACGDDTGLDLLHQF